MHLTPIKPENMNIRTSSSSLKNILATLCVAGIFLACGTAQAGWTVWNNTSTDGKWETAANWNNGVPDISSDAAIINDVSTAGAVTATTANDSFDYLRVGHVNAGTLIIDGATLSTTGASKTREGIGYDAGHIGILNLISGTMNFSTPTTLGNQVTGIAGTGSQGTVNQTGGLMSFGGANSNSVTLGSTNGTGLYDFTAGTLQSRRAFNITTGGTGTSIFHVNGYDASSSITIGNTAGATGDGAWLQGAGTTLFLSIDGATLQGSTLINIALGTDGAANTNDGKATFASGSFLNLDFNSGLQSGTWTVLSAAGGITDNGLALAAGVDDTKWSFAVVGNDLQVTYAVPEPSTFGLLLISLLAVMTFRRRGQTAGTWA